MKLSRAKLKSHVLGEFGIEWFRSYDMADVRRNTSLAIISSHIIDEGINAFLGGCNDEANQLFLMAKDWLTTAIAEGEIPRQLGPLEATRYTPNLHEAETFTHFGLCRWLTDEGFEQSSLQTAGQYALDYCVQHPSEFSSHGIVRYLLVAEKFDDIKRLFDSCPKLSPPSTLKRIKSEEKIAYVLASHIMGDAID